MKKENQGNRESRVQSFRQRKGKRKKITNWNTTGEKNEGEEPMLAPPEARTEKRRDAPEKKGTGTKRYLGTRLRGKKGKANS